MSSGKKIVCPNCRTALRIAKAGAVTCPECAHQFSIRRSRSKSSDERPGDSRLPTETESNSRPVDRDAKVNTRHDPDVAETADSEDANTPKISRRTPLLVGGGAALLTVGLVLGVMFQPSEPIDVPAVPTGDGGNTVPTVSSETGIMGDVSDDSAGAATATAHLEGHRPRGIPLFDSDVSDEPGGAAADSFRPASRVATSGSGRNSTTVGSTTHLNSPTDPASYWTDSTWSVVLNQGDIPMLNGVNVLSEVVTPSTLKFPLVMPAGEHLWQSSANGASHSLTVSRSFADHYLEQKAVLSSSGRLDFERLARETRPVGGAFNEPLLPHFWGNYFWQEMELAAAIRFWKLAARIEPGFAPSHLNLAYAAAEQKDTDTALRELTLAIHCNPLNAYGIDAHIHVLRERLGRLAVYDTAAYWSPGNYQATASHLTGTPQQVTQILNTVSLYATDWRNRVRALNNAGVYLNARSLPEHAIEPLQQAVRIVVQQQSLEQEAVLVSTVLGNLESAARTAGLAEHVIYGWLKASYEGQ